MTKKASTRKARETVIEMSDELAITYVPPRSLVPAAYNPRVIMDDERETLENGLKEFGLVDPIIARRMDGLIIGGHQRLNAAIALGHAKVPVIYLDNIDDDRAAALNVLLNNPRAQGKWDVEKLASLLSGLVAHNFDATVTGFSDVDLARLLGDGGSLEEASASLADVEFQIVVSCSNEVHQGALCAELESRGLKCRLLTL